MWNLSAFLPPGGIQKSPNEAPLSHEPVETAKMEEHDDEEDGEIQRTPSDHHYDENSNSSVPDNKSDLSQDINDHQSMPPPAKVKSPSRTPDKTPDTDLTKVFTFIENLNGIQPMPISSISDSDDNDDSVISGAERPKKKRPKKQRLRTKLDGGNSSSDESSRFSESRRRSSMDEKKPRGRPKNNVSLPPPAKLPNSYEATNTSSDNNSASGTKKLHKSPRKEPQNRKTNNRRKQSEVLKKSREMIPSSDGSSDEEARKPPKPSPSKAKEPSNHQSPAKKPSKKKQPPPPPPIPEKIKSPIASSSDSESEQPPKHSPYLSPVPPISHSSSEHSDSDASSRSSHEMKNKKIEIVSDKKKNTMLHRLFNVQKVSEGGKGGKGGAKGKGQVVVITPEDAQNQSKSNESTASSNGAVSVQNPKYLSPSSAFNTALPSVLVRIDLARIDLSRLQIPPEKLKNTVIRTKSPAVAVEAPSRKSKKRRRSSNHDEQERWRHHSSSNKNFDQLSVSSASSATSSSATSEPHQMENPAARVTSYTTNNYTNDRLNNNIDHKSKDMNSFYHSPSSVDTKLPKIKRENNTYGKEFGGYSVSPMKDVKPTNDFKNKIKQETKEDFDGSQDMRKRASSMTNNSHKYKDKRKRPDGTSDNSLPMPPTNHERQPMNGDLAPKQEVVKRVYVSYFERINDEIEQQAEAK